MYKVLEITHASPLELETELNGLDAEGWFAPFPIWNGNAIVLYRLTPPEPQPELITIDEERLREP